MMLYYTIHHDIHTMHYAILILCPMKSILYVMIYTIHDGSYTCSNTCTLLLIILCLIDEHCILNKYSHILCFPMEYIFNIYIIFSVVPARAVEIMRSEPATCGN